MQGHEGCGEIIDIGSDVTDKSFKIVRQFWVCCKTVANNRLKGDVVSLLAVPGCGKDSCLECSEDMSQLCTQGHHSGIGQDGFYAPYAAIDQRGVVIVPEGEPKEREQHRIIC